MSKKKAKFLKHLNVRAIISWSLYAAVFVVAVVFSVFNFLIVARNKTEKNVKESILSETAASALGLGSALTDIGYYGRGAAAAIENAGSMDFNEMISYARYLYDAVPGLYLTAVVDKEGRGFTSESRGISLSEHDYYLDSTVAKAAYTSDDKITGKAAYVWTVPHLIKNSVSGYICLFVEESYVNATLSDRGYGGDVSFVIINSKGDIISTFSNTSIFGEGENLLQNLKGAELEDLYLSQINMRAEKGNKMVFDASKDGEYKTISIAPTGVGDWQLAVIINKSYVDTVVARQLGEERNVLVWLAVFVCVFELILVVISLISKIKHGEESQKLADKADTDLLTGANNKMAAERKIQEYMDENPNTQCIMFLFDIDNFKKINDTLGHAFGDEVLKTLGQQLKNEFRDTDIVGRLGGDEFVLFLKNIRSDEQLEKEGVRLVQFFRRFKAGSYVKYSATASIGSVVFPRDAKSFEEAYKVSDKALYEAKRRGKNQLVTYSKDLEKSDGAITV